MSTSEKGEKPILGFKTKTILWPEMKSHRMNSVRTQIKKE